jgi:hypothetical protein
VCICQVRWWKWGYLRRVTVRMDSARDVARGRMGGRCAHIQTPTHVSADLYGSSGSKGAVPAGRRESDGHGVDDTRWVRWKVGEMKLILRPGRHAGGGGVSSLPGLMRYKNGMLNEEKRNGGRRNRTIPLPDPKTSRARPCPQGAATGARASSSIHRSWVGSSLHPSVQSLEVR